MIGGRLGDMKGALLADWSTAATGIAPVTGNRCTIKTNTTSPTVNNVTEVGCHETEMCRISSFGLSGGFVLEEYALRLVGLRRRRPSLNEITV